MGLDLDIDFVAAVGWHYIEDLDFLQVRHFVPQQCGLCQAADIHLLYNQQTKHFAAPYVYDRVQAGRARLVQLCAPGVNIAEQVLFTIPGASLSALPAPEQDRIRSRWQLAVKASVAKVSKHLDRHPCLEIFKAIRLFDPTFAVQNPHERSFSHLLALPDFRAPIASTNELCVLSPEWERYLTLAPQAAESLVGQRLDMARRVESGEAVGSTLALVHKLVDDQQG